MVESWCLSPAVYGREAGHTLDRLSIHRRRMGTVFDIFTCENFVIVGTWKWPHNLSLIDEQQQLLSKVTSNVLSYLHCGNTHQKVPEKQFAKTFLNVGLPPC
ncbi:hypothetical protein CHARACLAT_017093 [Characodon lateralis]|uniref:Uncharacterized protein n=1 Tax=Characodon lateralis TaxID=208331 RepID=A0ABU7DHC3_9TELE|nr:hypothetical protein [Characodon lateralis]